MLLTQNQLRISKLCCVRQQKKVFENLSFELNEGELLLVKGANGSGKSSLLRLLSGLSTPLSGEITWKEKSIASDDFRDHLHYIGHTNGIKLGLTVDENLSLVIAKEPESWSAILSTLGLSHHMLARSLSAGQKRKLALSKLFLVNKKIWILDEPLTSLDTATQTYFLERLESHLKNGGIAIMSSHQNISLNEVPIKTLSLSHE